MPESSLHKQFYRQFDAAEREELFNFSNVLMKSPLRYSLIERRFLYELAGKIRERFNQYGLLVRERWDNLKFQFTNNDLGRIAGKNGKKNTLHTYDVLRKLADRSVIQFHLNSKNELILGYHHWISGFEWNTETGDYTVTVSPELFDYVCNITSRFTRLNLNVGIRLKSKYSQKFFEICSMYTGSKMPFRYKDNECPQGKRYKINVLKLTIDMFRFLFGLTEVKDPKTGKIIEKGKYSRFKEIERYIILPAQTELYTLYHNGEIDVWFDYSVVRSGVGRSGSPKIIYIYLYTKYLPKSKVADEDRPHKTGETLDPFEDAPIEEQIEASKKEESNDREKKPNVKMAVSQSDNSLFVFDDLQQRQFVEQYLKRYMPNEEVNYYISRFDEQQKINHDAYTQVLQELQAKYRQARFAQGSDAYKRKNIVDFVFKENLKVYGWSVPPMK